MLTSLRIKNLALVDDLTWQVGPGLVCVTGETGAGKSMIVGALKLILGDRADRSLIRTGEDNCTIEAVFRMERPAVVNALLDESGLEPCEDDSLIIKRVMTGAGQNRQFINNGPATLNTLKELGQHLVDLHGPHDQQSLLSRERQLAMLDIYAQAGKAASEYEEAYRRWRGIERDLNELRTSERAGETELELLRHQVAEIGAAQLDPAEEEGLMQRYRLATNGSRLVEFGGAALAKLADDDDAAMAQLRHVQKSFRDIERLDPDFGMSKIAESALIELEELAAGLRDYLDKIELDPAAMTVLEERINVIESVKRKYGGSIATALECAERAALRLSRIENRGEAIAALEADLAAARQDVDRRGKWLGDMRRKAAPKLAKEISSHLLDLGFHRAWFEISLPPLPEPGSHGAEEADFLFAPNPGEPSKPLRLVASSGEMSRVMLAVKSALAREDAIPLLVFDEIDANVGGEIAAAVGRKMAALGQSHQVVAITHMPQVAALAACHYEVSKEFSHDRTHSRLRQVAGEERIDEIARMLGGSRESAIAHARNLLVGDPPSGGATPKNKR